LFLTADNFWRLAACALSVNGVPQWLQLKLEDGSRTTNQLSVNVIELVLNHIEQGLNSADPYIKSFMDEWCGSDMLSALIGMFESYPAKGAAFMQSDKHLPQSKKFTLKVTYDQPHAVQPKGLWVRCTDAEACDKIAWKEFVDDKQLVVELRYSPGFLLSHGYYYIARYFAKFMFLCRWMIRRKPTGDENVNAIQRLAGFYKLVLWKLRLWKLIYQKKDIGAHKKPPGITAAADVDRRIDVSLYMVKLRGAADIKTLQVAVSIADAMGSPEIFKSDVVTAVIVLHWDTYANRSHVYSLAGYLVLLGLFVAMTIGTEDTHTPLGQIAQYGKIVLACIFTVREVSEAMDGFFRWLFDLWNIFDIAAYSLMVSVYYNVYGPVALVSVAS
jgi:hypothetical protein